jgi:putative ABC transport system substrate-binding protein
MKRKWFLTLVVLLAFVRPQGADAQKVYRIGSLNTAEQFVDAFEGFKSRMVELGYKEGEKIRYEFYNARGDKGTLKDYAQKLVQDKVDLIVTSSTSATVAALEATEGTNIPVVFLSAGNPKRLVKSFASSGGNVTGVSSATLDITGKRFELLRELAPWAKRVAHFSNPDGVNFRANLAKVREEASRQGFALWEIEVRNKEDVVKATATLTRKTADAIFSPPDAMITDAIDIIVKQSIKERLPLVTSLSANVNKGCLATYAADYYSLGRQGAMLVDKILKGTRARDLPVEQPSKLKLIINRETAKSIGLEIPREILLRADEIIG